MFQVGDFVQSKVYNHGAGVIDQIVKSDYPNRSDSCRVQVVCERDGQQRGYYYWHGQDMLEYAILDGLARILPNEGNTPSVGVNSV